MSQLPVVNSLQMPLGNSLIDIRKPKPPLKKAITFVSPLLLVSIGLHGLAMLLPVPEPEKIVEETELPEPIQVSELPELEAPTPAPISVPAPAPIPEKTPVVTPPAPAAPQPVVVQPLEPEQKQPVEPQNAKPDLPVQDPAQKQDPVEPAPGGLAGSGSVVRTYKAVGTGRDQTFTFAFAKALSKGLYSGGSSITYTPMREGTLTISSPAGDNCFPKAQPIAGTNNVTLPASLFVVVGEGENNSEGFIQTVEIGKSTGYDEANDLITSVGLPDEAYDPIYNWLKDQLGGSFPFDTQGPVLAYLIFKVEAVFENHSCPS